MTEKARKEYASNPDNWRAQVIWNPVSSGYPEKKRWFYLVSVRRIETSDAFVTIAEWKIRDDEQGDFYLYGSPEKLNDLGCPVLAWAELPEPWEEETDGGR